MRGSKRRVTARAAVWSAALSVGVGMLSAAPAVAAPDAGDDEGPGAASPDREDAGTPQIWPRPHELRMRAGGIDVRGRVALVARPDADRYALDVIRDALRGAGASEVYDVTPGAPLTGADGGA
ncbi:hyaluronidase, partial [Streptomyces sp. A7024]|nr:hyaluronidase [Streptomyces coryli]